MRQLVTIGRCPQTGEVFESMERARTVSREARQKLFLLSIIISLVALSSIVDINHFRNQSNQTQSLITKRNKRLSDLMTGLSAAMIEGRSVDSHNRIIQTMHSSFTSWLWLVNVSRSISSQLASASASASSVDRGRGCE